MSPKPSSGDGAASIEISASTHDFGDGLDCGRTRVTDIASAVGCGVRAAAEKRYWRFIVQHRREVFAGEPVLQDRQSNAEQVVRSVAAQPAAADTTPDVSPVVLMAEEDALGLRRHLTVVSGELVVLLRIPDRRRDVASVGAGLTWPR